MEKEFYVLVLRQLMAINAKLTAGSYYSEEDRHLKEQTENFVKRCEEQK